MKETYRKWWPWFIMMTSTLPWHVFSSAAWAICAVEVVEGVGGDVWSDAALQQSVSPACHLLSHDFVGWATFTVLIKTEAFFNEECDTSFFETVNISSAVLMLNS